MRLLNNGAQILGLNWVTRDIALWREHAPDAITLTTSTPRSTRSVIAAEIWSPAHQPRRRGNGSARRRSLVADPTPQSSALDAVRGRRAARHDADGRASVNVTKITNGGLRRDQLPPQALSDDRVQCFAIEARELDPTRRPRCLRQDVHGVDEPGSTVALG